MKSLRPLLLIASLAVASWSRAEVLLERTMLPFEAAPSSFAVGLPSEVSFCFDPVRGGVSYIWTGGYLDLATVRPGPGKLITEAKLLGTVAHRESGAAPLRRGDPARVPVVEFKGYTVRADAVEFRYTIDGVPVRETISARADGKALVRRFDVSAGADAAWSYVVDGKPALSLGAAGAKELTLEIPLTTGGAR